MIEIKKITAAKAIDDKGRIEVDLWCSFGSSGNEKTKAVLTPNDKSEFSATLKVSLDDWVKDGGKVLPYVPPLYDAAAAKEAAKVQAIEYIDQLREKLTARFTKAEQDGWIKTLDEAHALIADQNAAAPGVRLQAKIEGIDALDLAKGIVAASGITSLIPNLAAGFRSKTNSLIEATDGSQEQIAKVFEQLRGLGEAIASAVEKRDQKALQKALGAF